MGRWGGLAGGGRRRLRGLGGARAAREREETDQRARAEAVGLGRRRPFGSLLAPQAVFWAWCVSLGVGWGRRAESPRRAAGSPRDIGRGVESGPPPPPVCRAPPTRRRRRWRRCPAGSLPRSAAPPGVPSAPRAPPKQRLALSGRAARPEAVSRAWPRPGDACPGGGPRDAAVSFRRRALPPGLWPRGASCPRARGVLVSLQGVGRPASSHPSVVGRLGRTRA